MWFLSNFSKSLSIISIFGSCRTEKINDIITFSYSNKSSKRLYKWEVTSNFLATYVDVLLDNDYDPEVIFSKYKGHIKKIVRDLPECDLVISIGGDGTFNEAVTGNKNVKINTKNGIKYFFFIITPIFS